MSLEESLTHKYEVVLLGVLKALVTLGLMPDAKAKELVLSAMQGSQDTVVDAVYNRVGDQLNRFVVELNSSMVEIEHLRKDNARISHLENELKNSISDNNTLRELNSLESTSQIQALRDKLRQLKVSCLNKVRKVQTEAVSKEEALREAFDQEISALRRGYEAKIATLNASLKTEHRRRKDTQSLLSAKEESIQRLFAEHDEKLSSSLLSMSGID